ncbi:hypothetical protein O181_082100 [Austropuccinia psidii MF-1]|uniref:Integrase catalytic domain-containing protein n=1 Tax=Austropuccinia psidii MF-1 TaxID=1389203 RepID=A0A9Q3FKD0_9BASI|nr:hypothetical protein [Austropuccinia psidii MF-1]
MFAMLKKLGIKANELEGLLAQAACHTPATLNQLVTTAILAKGEEKPNSTFVGQVILNASTKADENTRQLSPFVYRMADPPTTPIHSHQDHRTLGVSRPTSDNPPTILSTNLGTPAFTVVAPGIRGRLSKHKGSRKPQSKPSQGKDTGRTAKFGLELPVPTCEGFPSPIRGIPEELQTANAKEFVSLALSKLGISLHPLLPYSPQENSKAELLNQTLGDMARAMLSESGIPDHFWQFAYASACYLPHCLPNRRCPDSLPHQVFYRWPPSITTLYPFGEMAIVHVPAVQHPNKIA